MFAGDTITQRYVFLDLRLHDDIEKFVATNFIGKHYNLSDAITWMLTACQHKVYWFTYFWFQSLIF